MACWAPFILLTRASMSGGRSSFLAFDRALGVLGENQLSNTSSLNEKSLSEASPRAAPRLEASGISPGGFGIRRQFLPVVQVTLCKLRFLDPESVVGLSAQPCRRPIR